MAHNNVQPAQPRRSHKVLLHLAANGGTTQSDTSDAALPTADLPSARADGALGVVERRLTDVKKICQLLHLQAQRHSSRPTASDPDEPKRARQPLHKISTHVLKNMGCSFLCSGIAHQICLHIEIAWDSAE